jgi:hypothetical protein
MATTILRTRARDLVTAHVRVKPSIALTYFAMSIAVTLWLLSYSFEECIIHRFNCFVMKDRCLLRLEAVLLTVLEVDCSSSNFVDKIG